MKIARDIRTAACFLMAFLAFGCAAMGADYGTGNAVLAGEVLPAGRVKALAVTAASQLIGGHRHEGLVGDFKMYNSRVGFVISGARASSGMDPYGGMVEEAGLLRKEGGAYRWRNLLGDFYYAFYHGSDPLANGRLFQAKKAWIVKDGTDGTAIIRIEGSDAEFPTRRELFLRPSKPMGVLITVDYILRPDSMSLEMKVSIRNTGDKAKNISFGQLFLMGDGAPLFMPGCGFDMTCFRNTKTALIAAPGDGVSYGWFSPGVTMESMDQLENLMIVEIGKIKAPAGGDGSFTTWFTVAPG